MELFFQRENVGCDFSMQTILHEYHDIETLRKRFDLRQLRAATELGH